MTTHTYARATRREDLNATQIELIDRRAEQAAKTVKRHFNHQAKCAVGEMSRPISKAAKGHAYDDANVVLRALVGFEGTDLPRPTTMDDIAGIIRAWRGKGF